MKKEFKSAELLYLMRRISHNFTIELELNLKEKEISGTQVYSEIARPASSSNRDISYRTVS